MPFDFAQAEQMSNGSAPKASQKTTSRGLQAKNEVAHTSESNHQVQYSEVNNTLNNNTNWLSTKILLSYILHRIRTSATYKKYYHETRYNGIMPTKRRLPTEDGK